MDQDLAQLATSTFQFSMIVLDFRHYFHVIVSIDNYLQVSFPQYMIILKYISMHLISLSWFDVARIHLTANKK